MDAAEAHVATPVAVEVARRQDRADAVGRLGSVEDGRAVLAPELVSGRREPAGAAVEDVDRAGIVDAADPLDGHAHGHVVASVAVEVARGQGIAEVVAPLGGAEDAGAVLAPELVSARREPAGAP